MCGILGVVGKELSSESLNRGLNSLHHRGPDGQGSFTDPVSQVHLAHARLSIIDLAKGGQPLFNEDEGIILVCNGEIYDFERLREELKTQGHHFHSGSDSEVIIHLYEQFGMDFFKYLRGEFAFILYDRRNEKVIAARDRFGIKPLFYSDLGEGAYALGSEAKAIFATGLVTPQLDPVILRNMLSFAGGGNVFKNLKLLPPASYLEIDLKAKSSVVATYWSLDLPRADEKLEMTLDQAKKLVQEKLDESVRLRLRADVPVGVYLSGGIDSSAVAGTMAKYVGKNLEAFSISFTDEKNFNESELAAQSARALGCRFHELKLSQEDLLKNFEDCLWFSEHPSNNLHGVGKFLLSKLAREKVKVVLTGEGGDELFLGYPYFQDGVNEATESFGNSLGRVSEQKEVRKKNAYLEKLKNILGFEPLPEMLNFQKHSYQLLLRRLFHRNFRELLKEETSLQALSNLVPVEESAGREEVVRKQAYSIKNFLANYILIVLGDRQEMAHSLEGRTPLLDHELFELSKKIPTNLKIKDGEEKFILKEAVKDRVTPEIYKRKKWPYFAPMTLVQENASPEMDRLVKKYLNKEAIVQAGIFNYPTLRRCQFIMKILKISPLWQARFNSLLMVVLSVQILATQYGPEFTQNLKKYGPKARAT